MHDEPEGIEWVKRYRAEPGDTLIIKADRTLTPSHVERVATQMEKVFPEQTIVVLAPGIDIEVCGQAPDA